MSNKPYLIVQIVNGELTSIIQRPTRDEAYDQAVAIAKESAEDRNEDSLREEMERDSNIKTDEGNWVYVTQVMDG